MTTIEELAVKCGALIYRPDFDRSRGFELQDEYTFDKVQLQAFAEGYAKLVSSEPVGELRCDATTGHTYGVFWYERSAPPINSKVYSANPINTQLQTERDELEKRATSYAVEMNTQAVRLGDAIAYIKKLEDALIKSFETFTNNLGILCSANYDSNANDQARKDCDEALASRPVSLEQLLGD